MIGGCNYNDSATPLHLKFEVLKLAELYKLEVAKLIYVCIQNNSPYSLSVMFIKTSQISARVTRSSINTNDLDIPRYRTNELQRSIRYQGVSKSGTQFTQMSRNCLKGILFAS